MAEVVADGVPATTTVTEVPEILTAEETTATTTTMTITDQMTNVKIVVILAEQVGVDEAVPPIMITMVVVVVAVAVAEVGKVTEIMDSVPERVMAVAKTTIMITRVAVAVMAAVVVAAAMILVA